jgi:phosphodiesterase/alkaline phosphatase D-like protein
MMCWVRPETTGNKQVEAFMCMPDCDWLANLDAASLLADYLSNNKIDNTVVLTGDIHTHWVRSRGIGSLHDDS